MRTLSAQLPTDKIVAETVEVLKNGGMVVYPTETCYGIGVDATNHAAVGKLIKYKGSRKNKPISVAVCDEAMAQKYIEFNSAAENLFDNFLPGPITVVCQGKHCVDHRLESETGSLGIRYPKHDLALKIIRAFGRPITSTSANVSNGKTPYEISDILENISDSKKELIDLITDAGRLPHHAPSTIVDTTLNTPQVLRQGEFVFDNKNVKSYVSNSTEETVELGRQLIINNEKLIIEKCLIIALQGELGAGKTQFAKGIARGLGVKDNIKSPTFILCSEYEIKNFSVSVIPAKAGIQNRLGNANLDPRLRGDDKVDYKLFHIDTWRMQNQQELLDIGFEKMLSLGNVIVIEWGQKVFDILKKVEKRKNVKVVWATIETLKKNRRKITMSFPI